MTIAPTRKDAAANRRRILETAYAAFAVDGIDVPMRELARRLGLGTATLHRHFPTRLDLVRAVLAEEVARCAREIEDAAAEPDARLALELVIRSFADQRVRNRAVTDALLGARVPGAAFVDERREHAAAFAALVDRARDAGELRDGTTVDDARLVLRAIAGFGGSAQAVRQLSTLLTAGLLTDPAQSPSSARASERAGSDS